MSAKVINHESFQTHEEYESVISLAASIKKRHTLIATEQEQLDTEKKELCRISTDIFFNDVEEKFIPDIFGNHEYHIPEDIVSVNFKMASKPFNQIDKKSANDYLKDKFGEETYKKLFDETDTYTVAASETDIISQAGRHPELFRIALRDDLDIEALKALVIEHPELVTVQVRDVNGYAEAYPGHVEKITTVKVKKSFLNKCEGLGGDILKKTRSVLKTLLRASISTAVICGNATKTSKK